MVNFYLVSDWEFEVMSYGERKAKREQEIEGLKEALTILSGEALLQASALHAGLCATARHGVRLVGQTSEGPFSAVSKRNFAIEYAFESSCRDLHKALLCTALKSHFFKKICQNFPKFAKIFRIFAKFTVFQTDFLRKF